MRNFQWPNPQKRNKKNKEKQKIYLNNMEAYYIRQYRNKTYHNKVFIYKMFVIIKY